MFCSLDVPDGGVDPLQECSHPAGEQLHPHGILRLLSAALFSSISHCDPLPDVVALGRQALDHVGSQLRDLADLVLYQSKLSLESFALPLESLHCWKLQLLGLFCDPIANILAGFAKEDDAGAAL